MLIHQLSHHPGTGRHVRNGQKDYLIPTIISIILRLGQDCWNIAAQAELLGELSVGMKTARTRGFMGERAQVV
jgi:hypothetical protein